MRSCAPHIAASPDEQPYGTLLPECTLAYLCSIKGDATASTEWERAQRLHARGADGAEIAAGMSYQALPRDLQTYGVGIAPELMERITQSLKVNPDGFPAVMKVARRSAGLSSTEGWGTVPYTRSWPPPNYGLLWLMHTRATALWDDDAMAHLQEERGRVHMSNHEDEDVDLAITAMLLKDHLLRPHRAASAEKRVGKCTYVGTRDFCARTHRSAAEKCGRGSALQCGVGDLKAQEPLRHFGMVESSVWHYALERQKYILTQLLAAAALFHSLHEEDLNPNPNPNPNTNPNPNLNPNPETF